MNKQCFDNNLLKVREILIFNFSKILKVLEIINEKLEFPPSLENPYWMNLTILHPVQLFQDLGESRALVPNLSIPLAKRIVCNVL